MRHTFRHLKRCIILLALTVISFGFGGGKVNLCFMPDGDVHLEQSHSSCGLAGGCSPASTGFTVANKDRFEGQGHCLDVSLGSDAADHHYRHSSQLPAPAMIPLGSPITLTQAEQQPPRHIPPAITPPQLVSLQSVVLLI